MTQFHFNFDPNSFQQFKTSRKPKMKPGKAHVTALIITLVLALLRTRREGKQGGAQVNIKKIFPWFVLLFLVASIITTLLPIPAGLVSFLKSASKFFIVMAMAAIGLNTDIVHLVKSGGKPILMGLCCWVAIAAVSLAMQHLLGLW